MPPEDSIAGWVTSLRAGDEAAAQRLWDAYFPRLVGLARVKLAGLPRRAAADEEDVALSALDSFCARARRGDFPDLRDRDGLWRVLMTVTARKAARLVRDQGRLKRGGGEVAGESAFGADAAAGGDPTPSFEAEASDSLLRLLDALADDDLRRIALWKMNGHTNSEIAALLGCAPATVERRLALIRKTWEREGAAGP